MPERSYAAAGCMILAPLGCTFFFGFRYTNRSRKETRLLSEMSADPVSG
jgi:hypothetical protein